MPFALEKHIISSFNRLKKLYTMALVFPSKYMSTSQDYPIHVHGWIRIHKNGHCERLVGNNTIPAGTDPVTGVQSKDVIISHKTKVSVRIYIPKNTHTDHKLRLPTVIYIHGGGFLTESTASSTYHPTLNLITAESKVILVSVNYRLAPEYLLPIAYEDSWEAIKWVASHSQRTNIGNGHEPWLNDYADLKNVYFAGDSAGANIAHNMGIRVGLELDPAEVIKLKGVILLHPFFGGKDPIGVEGEKHKEHKAFSDQVWKLVNLTGVGLDDPLFDPGMDPRVSSFGCSKILLCVGEKDKLKGRGSNYKKLMEKSGWKGKVVVMENKGEGHVFFLFDTLSKNACMLRTKICMFINPIRSKV